MTASTPGPIGNEPINCLRHIAYEMINGWLRIVGEPGDQDLLIRLSDITALNHDPGRMILNIWTGPTQWRIGSGIRQSREMDLNVASARGEAVAALAAELHRALISGDR